VRRMPDGRLTNRYDYHFVRLWRLDVESFLHAGVGLLPLAPLADVPDSALPDVVGRMAERINREPGPRAAKLWAATYLLMGLRYSDDLTDSLLEGVQTMQESTTYQKILREGRKEGLLEGRIAEAQRMLLRQGRKKFHDPDAATVAALEAINDLERLETMGERILDSEIRDWDELLEMP
jgi:predicted transposase YdaD